MARPNPRDPWSARLHGLWRTAFGATSTDEFAHEVYDGISELPGVLCVFGSRVDADDRVRVVRWAEGAGVRTSPEGLADDVGRWLAAEAAHRSQDVITIPVDRLARHAPGLAARLTAAGARDFVVAVRPLAVGDVGLLGVGTVPGPHVEDVRIALGQLLEIAALADQRAAEQRVLDDRQVEDSTLAEASLRMDASLDVTDTLRAVVRMAVPALADGAAVHVNRDGRMVQIAVAHVDPDREPLLAEHLRRDRWAGAATARGDRETRSDDETWPSGLPADVDLATMTISVLRARGRVVGLLTFFHHDRPDRRITVPFLRDLAGRAALAIDNATLYEQRRADVLSLQQHLLPARLPEVGGIELAAGYNVADHALEVGGDFYGVVDHGLGNITTLMGDVCGRGAPAAALAGLARHTLETVLGRGVAAPRAVEILNSKMLDEGISRFLTLATATFSPTATSDLRVETHSAGHPPPLVLRREGLVEETACGGRLVGVLPELRLRPATDHLRLGDCLVLLTDGLIEARDDQGRFFGDTELLPMLSRVRGLPLPTMIATLLAGTETYQVNDDAAVLAVRNVGVAALDSVLPATGAVPAALDALRGLQPDHDHARLPDDLTDFVERCRTGGIDQVAVTVHGDDTWARVELRAGDDAAWAELTA